MSDIIKNDLYIYLGSPAFDAGISIEGSDFLGLLLGDHHYIDEDAQISQRIDIGVYDL